MRFISYKTAWAWQHTLRAAMVPSDREPLGPLVQAAEALSGERAARTTSWFWRPPSQTEGLAHVENNDEGTLTGRP